MTGGVCDSHQMDISCLQGVIGLNSHSEYCDTCLSLFNDRIVDYYSPQWSVLSKAARTGWANLRFSQIRLRLNTRFFSCNVLCMLERICNNTIWHMPIKIVMLIRKTCMSCCVRQGKTKKAILFWQTPHQIVMTSHPLDHSQAAWFRLILTTWYRFVYIEWGINMYHMLC